MSTDDSIMEAIGMIYTPKRNHTTEEVITHPGGASSTRKPRYALVPPVALAALAARFELGEKKYGTGGGAYSALSPRREQFLSKEWTVARLEHVIAHALHALQVIHGQAPDDDDDAGAIMFGGAVLADYQSLTNTKLAALAKEVNRGMQNASTSSQSYTGLGSNLS